jgi:hypothetical protein
VLCCAVCGPIYRVIYKACQVSSGLCGEWLRVEVEERELRVKTDLSFFWEGPFAIGSSFFFCAFPPGLVASSLLRSPFALWLSARLLATTANKLIASTYGI